MSETFPEKTLRRRVLLGGTHLLLRRGILFVLQLVGLMLTTRLLGPSAYGVFHSAQGLHTFLVSLGVMGVQVYLIRAPRGSPRELYDLAFWWLLGVSVILVLGCGAVAGIRFGGSPDDGFSTVAIAMMITAPLALIRHVPQAMLERELDYRYTAFLDIGGQLVFYGVALAAAFAGGGVWALVIGFWCSQVVQTGGFFWATRYRPRWYWHKEQLRAMLQFGFTYSLAGWIASVRDLLPALLLLPYAGEKAAGYFALVERLLSPLSFPKEVASRLALPVFARIQDNLTRLRAAMGEAVRLQSLALGASVAGFAAVAPFVLPHLLGQRWDIALLLQVFSLGATRLLLSGLFALQGSALAVKKLNWVSVRGNIVFAIVLVAGAYLAVAYLSSPYKLTGFLVADLSAFTASYLYKNYYLARYIGRPRYGAALLWTVSAICALFAPTVSGWLYLIAAAFLVNPFSYRELRALVRELRAAAHNPLSTEKRAGLDDS
ncbi:MAG: oligosaccharide flippase family protein [Fimbriimonadales bacterium]|nr:oligosaccharide flippase family protein [Fimbriimonadales bacterium]